MPLDSRAMRINMLSYDLAWLGLADVHPPNLPWTNPDHSQVHHVKTRKPSSSHKSKGTLHMPLTTVRVLEKKNNATSTNHFPSTLNLERPSDSCSQDAIVLSLNHGQQRGRRGFWRSRTTLNGGQKHLTRHAPDVSDPNC